MKLFLIGTLLFTGGGAAAMQNETVRENVSGIYQNVRQRVQKRAKAHTFENLRENGFPYPNEERLEQLTEEQQVAIISAIDQINATYDFGSMTDEEIKEALVVIQEELNLLNEELGLDIPDNFMQRRFRRRVSGKTKEIITERLLEDLRTNGIELPSEEKLANLTEEQTNALVAKIEEFNTTYDWANMTDEEIMDAMLVVKEELKQLHEEYDFPVPVRKHEQEEAPVEETEGTEEV